MFYDPNKVLGAAPPAEIARYLELIGDYESAQRIREEGGTGQAFSIPYITVDQWRNRGCKIGYLAEGGGKRAKIIDAVGMQADESLKTARLKLSLDRFYVENYPGTGVHTILCEFTGRNQAAQESEATRFALTVRVEDKSAAAVTSMPIFVGINAGGDGLAIEGQTINVCSHADDALLEAIDSPGFQEGLSLLTTSQPVLKPFVNLAEGMVKSILRRHKNRDIFNFAMGLDFSKNATAVKLRLGSYIIVQTNETDWDWDDFEWDNNTLKSTGSDGEPVQLNYMVLGVSLSQSDV